jgi:hypothetical protein
MKYSYVQGWMRLVLYWDRCGRDQRPGILYGVHAAQWAGGYMIWILVPLGRHIELVFLNVYGAQESIPRNEFRQLM